MPWGVRETELSTVEKEEIRAIVTGEKPKWGKWGPPPEGRKELNMEERIFGDISNNSPAFHFVYNIAHTLTVKPVEWLHENVVMRFRGPEYPYYHRRYRRVPTIDECYFHDHKCQWEARFQMMRDKLVEEAVVSVLRDRAMDCISYEGYSGSEVADPTSKCGELKRDFDVAQVQFGIKYGEISFPVYADRVLMKQKHRLIWERRHGKLPMTPGFDAYEKHDTSHMPNGGN